MRLKPRSEYDNPWDLINSEIMYARRMEADTSATHLEVLNQFYFTCQKACRRSGSWSDHILHMDSTPYTFAVQCGLHHYLRAKLSIETVIPKATSGGSAVIRKRFISSPESRSALEIYKRGCGFDAAWFWCEPTGDGKCHHKKDADFDPGAKIVIRDWRQEDSPIYIYESTEACEIDVDIIRRWADIIMRVAHEDIKIDHDSQSHLLKLFQRVGPSPELLSEVQSALPALMSKTENRIKDGSLTVRVTCEPVFGSPCRTAQTTVMFLWCYFIL